MKKIAISPMAIVADDSGSTLETRCKSIYLNNIDSTRKVAATWYVTGTFGGATVAGKFVESDDDSSYTDVADGAFLNLTEATPEEGASIEFTLGNFNLAFNDGSGGNYKKFLAFAYITSGGGAGAIDIRVDIDGIWTPDDNILLKLYQEP